MLDTVGTIRVGTVYAGRNYAAHAREMGAAPEPVAFLKPATAICSSGAVIEWPIGSSCVHHEVEIVLLLGSGGRRLSEDQAAKVISGVAVGVDLTARDLQSDAKAHSAPWARSKGFPGSAPVSRFRRYDAVRELLPDADLTLEVDGAQRQSGRTSQMLLAPHAIVALLSSWFELRSGDLIFTGTPAGVGPLEPGQPVVATSRALDVELAFRLAPPRNDPPTHG